MRRSLAVSLLVGSVLGAACKDKPAATSSGSGSAPPKVVIDNPDPHAGIGTKPAPPTPGSWDMCKAGLVAAATAPQTKRVSTILEACRPCGEWKPILSWQTEPQDGGPERRVIEHAMEGCKAWCTPNAKMRFMGTLDDARVKKSRTPWRELASICGEGVSARPDGRYVTAPWFALDRIARYAAKEADGPALLAAIELPLPMVSQTGVGVKLPDAPVMKPETLDAQITLITASGGDTITVGKPPTGKLTADGIIPAGDMFPGTLVKPTEVAAAIEKATKVAVFTPSTTPVTKIYALLGAAKNKPLLIAAASRTSMEGWEQHGVVPVSLTIAPERKKDPEATPPLELILGASPDDAVKAAQTALAVKGSVKEVSIVVKPDATVAGLVTVLGALAYFEWPTVGLVKSP